MVVVASVRAMKAPDREVHSDSQGALLALSSRLIDLVGTDGYDALLRRAEQLAARDQRPSQGVRPTAARQPRLIRESHRSGLCSCARGPSPVAFGALLTALLALVDEFLGPEITHALLEQDDARVPRQ